MKGPFPEHLSDDMLKTWSSLPNAQHLKWAYHLSTGCPACIAFLGGLRGDPLLTATPFEHALSRWSRHPRVHLSASSRLVRLFIHPKFRPRDFPELLLEESLLAPCAGPRKLSLPKILGSLLWEPENAPYRARVACELSAYHLGRGKPREAAEAIEQAKRHLQDLEDGHDITLSAELALAEIRLARRTDRNDVFVNKMCDLEEYRQSQLPGCDRVRRFEITCEVLSLYYGSQEASASDYRAALARLDDGTWEHELIRLNALIRKGDSIKYMPVELSREVADELEDNLEDFTRYGGHEYCRTLLESLRSGARSRPRRRSFKVAIEGG